MENNEIKPWYKQFWPWFLISIPFSSVVLSFIMVSKAVNQPHVMVTDSYYKKGLDMNQDLSLDKNALQLGISAEISAINDGYTIQVVLNKGEAPLPSYLLINFEHPTIKEKDANHQLAGIDGNYTVAVQEPIEGRRYVTLLPNTKDWQLKGEINFPSASATKLSPIVY